MIDISYELKENRFIDVNGEKIPAESLNVKYSSKETSLNYIEKYAFRRNFVFARLNGKYGISDKTGKQIIPCIYDELYEHIEEDCAFFRVEKEDKWGLLKIMDNTVEEVIPFIYDYVDYERAEEDCVFYSVEKEDKWGIWKIMDNTVKEVIPCIYDSVWGMFGNVFMFEKNGKYGVLDKTGKQIIPCIYEEFESSSPERPYLPVRKKDKWGLIDKNGKKIIPCIYDLNNVFELSKKLESEDIKQEREKCLSNMTAKIQGINSKEFPVISTYSLNVKFNDKTTTYELKSIEEANMIIDYLNEIVYSYEDKISKIEKQTSKNIQKVLKIK